MVVLLFDVPHDSACILAQTHKGSVRSAQSFSVAIEVRQE